MAVRDGYSGKTTLLWAGAIVTALAAVFFEGRRRAGAEGRRALATAAIVVGLLAFAIGASVWVFGEELGI
jgi:hypothetical protein